MLFNSIEFAIFLPIVFAVYWAIPARYVHWQNLLVVVASYFFYGCWDWRFLALIFVSTLLDFRIGQSLMAATNPKHRKRLLLASIAVNLGFLGFFKYYNFFVENFTQAFTLFGKELHADTLHIILPVGISFYTFQTLSYSIDVYRRKLEPTHDFVAFAAFVSFFPQLVAGPIERASHLLPQFFRERQFEYQQGVDGLRQILWGLFKKIVIADNCAVYVNSIFTRSDQASGSTLVLAAVLFSFQIYGDFSGYSDIAIGSARLFGFELKQNFAYPYFSRSMAEFWRRWHISLSTWFRDYLYIPLGGSQGSIALKVRNTFIIFLVSGFWHGANWTFLAWGLLNALFFLPSILTGTNREHLAIAAQGKCLPSIRDFFKITFTFLLTTFAWIFFRAQNLQHAFSYIKGIFSASLFSLPENAFEMKGLFVHIALFMLVEWIGREKPYGLAVISKYSSRTIRYLVYYLLIGTIIHAIINGGGEQQFIYFQF